MQQHKVLALLAVVVLGCAALVAPSPAHAQAEPVVEPERAAPSTEQSARAAFEAGRLAYDHGRFAEALGHFELAYELNRHPKLLFNIARAAEFDGRSRRAIDAYGAYLSAIPDADNRDFVEARLARLREGHEPAASTSEPSTARSAPTPRETAALAIQTSPTSRTTDQAPERRPVWKRAWFWSVIGVAVAGAVATAVVLSRDEAEAEHTADVHIETLGAH
jgi:tetratricopeptide (TPR) repeat protein